MCATCATVALSISGRPHHIEDIQHMLSDLYAKWQSLDRDSCSDSELAKNFTFTVDRSLFDRKSSSTSMI